MDDDKPQIEWLKLDLIEMVKTGILLNQFLASGAIFILAIPVFPIFVIVSRSNNDDDKKTSVYPIINYLYKGTVCSYSVFILIGILVFIKRFFITNELIYTVAHSIFLLLVTYITTHHWLLSLLALQRFLLYHFPNMERYVNLTESATNRVLILLYSVFYSKIITFIVISCQDGACSLFGPNDLLFKLMTIDLLLSYGLLLFCSSLYIPIYRSIRKHSHLVSIIKNQPHHYILLQSFLIVAAKLGTTCAQLHIPDGFENTHFDRPTYIYLANFDVLSTSVLIQVSYLLSNRKNMEKLKRLLSIRNSLECLFPRMFKNNRIEPIGLNVYESTVNTAAS